MKNKIENNFIGNEDNKKIESEEIKKDKISEKMGLMFLGLENEGGNKEIRKHKEEISGIKRNPQYPNLDEQDGFYGDDENPNEPNLEEEKEEKEDNKDGI